VIGEASDALALSPTVVRFKATIPGDAGGEVTVELTNVPDSMSEAKAKYLPETGFFFRKKEKLKKLKKI
jgi:hypothetical protein